VVFRLEDHPFACVQLVGQTANGSSPVTERQVQQLDRQVVGQHGALGRAVRRARDGVTTDCEVLAAESALVTARVIKFLRS
jgi:hypothetical protein